MLTAGGLGPHRLRVGLSAALFYPWGRSESGPSKTPGSSSGESGGPLFPQSWFGGLNDYIYKVPGQSRF